MLLKGRILAKDWHQNLLQAYQIFLKVIVFTFFTPNYMDDYKKSLISMIERTKYIRVLGMILFILTFLLISIMFWIMYFHFNEIKEKIEFLRYGYLILNYILYIKLFVTEGVLARKFPLYYPVKVLGGKVPFLNMIKKELSFYRQHLTEKYNFFTSKELSEKYKYFMKNTNITIDALTVNKPEKIILMFNNALSRISASLNDLESNVNLLYIENRSSYELMYNLINEYYIKWENVTTILFNDSIHATNLKNPIMFILVLYIFLSLIIFFIFLKLLSRFSLEREKPIIFNHSKISIILLLFILYVIY